MSVVTLIDADRQFFKSCVGLPEPWASERGSSLELSFCRLAVEADADLVVRDSHSDDRVQNHPAVEKMGVRAYAGVPVHARSGETLGTLCVVDGEPRDWTESDLDTLRTLAASVESEIELIQLTTREREHLQLLSTIIESSPLAVAVIDDQECVHLWNVAAEAMFGMTAEQVLGQPLPVIPVGDSAVDSDLRQQLKDRVTVRGLAACVRHSSGHDVHVKIAAAPLSGFEGQTGRSLLIFDDVSEQVRLDTERDRLLSQLREESALREALLDQLPAGAVVAELPSGRVVSANERARELAGGDFPDRVNAEALGRYVGYRPDGTAYQVDEWPLARTIMKGETVTNEEILFERADGDVRTLLVSSQLVVDDSGDHAQAISTFTDISELRASEAARHLSEEKARRIIDSSHDCIKILSLEGELLSMSPGGQTLLEIDDVDSVCGCQWVQFWVGEARREAEAAIAKANAGQSGRFRGVCPTMKSGTRKWWDVIVTPILGEDGRPESLLSISRDVTDAVKAEEEREALIELEIKAREDAETARERYRNLVNGLDAIVWEADAKTWEFKFVSQRAEEILGYRIEDWLGNPDFWPGIIHPDDRDSSITFCRSACDKCMDHDFEYRAITSDGDTVWLRDIVYVVPDDDGNPHHLRGVMVDVTARKKLEQELRERAEELGRMDNRKNQFLAVLAHELRNPLAPISNAVELLKLCSHDPQQIAEIRDTLEGQVTQLIRLIDDLMDVSRITRGKIKLQKEKVSVDRVLDTSLNAVRPACDRRGQTLLARMDDAKTLIVEGDRVRLAQVFTNILTNACKYTPDGGTIALRCRVVNERVEISIEDNGVGIDEKDADSIFEMFTQVESSITRSQGGLGIGLTLVRQLVELHGGTIELDRTPREQGSRFVVQLPLAAAVPRKQTVSSHARPIESLDIVVIDDQPAVAKMLGRLVEAMGHKVTLAFSADEGIEVAEKQRPNIVFSDICMPDKSGYEVAEALRASPKLQSSMIVAMTGNGQPDDVVQAIESGFHKHLVKPASMDTLKELFDQYSRSRSEPMASDAQASP
ncbi:MAG: hypothetical protein Fues2KO_10960 [Fuerstiella sp.]